MKLSPKRKPYLKKGTLPKISKEKNISKEILNRNYKELIKKINEKNPQGLSKEQKHKLKEMFLKNPHITASEVNTMMSYLASIGKGKN